MVPAAHERAVRMMERSQDVTNSCADSSSPPPPGLPALEVRGLQVAYGERRILEHIDMTVPRGEIRVILGGSGSGKSTCLRAILGLIPSTGSVKLLGQELNGLRERQRQLHQQRIGVMFQNGALFGSLTVAQNVALPLLEHARVPSEVAQELVRMKLNLVGMGHAEHLYPAQLSGGMKKRAALARAMILDPELLFCDEPSAGLDPLTSAELDALLLHVRALFGTTIVVVTHELQSIETIADSVIMLGKGRVIAEGPIEQVKAQGIPEVEHYFARHLSQTPSIGMTVAQLFGFTPRGHSS